MQLSVNVQSVEVGALSHICVRFVFVQSSKLRVFVQSRKYKGHILSLCMQSKGCMCKPQNIDRNKLQLGA